jgi:Bacterial nucleoid DNA-binding protein
MNKRDLIDAISGRLGDKKSATEAVNAVLETIQSAVASGDKVAITGFGVLRRASGPPARPATRHRRDHPGAEFLGAQVPRRRGLQGAGQRREAQEVTRARQRPRAASGRDPGRRPRPSAPRPSSGAAVCGSAVCRRASANRSPGRLRSAVWMIRSTSWGSGRPEAAHIIGNPRPGSCPASC